LLGCHEVLDDLDHKSHGMSYQVDLGRLLDPVALSEVIHLGADSLVPAGEVVREQSLHPLVGL
jgi:hypothetical protein